MSLLARTDRSVLGRWWWTVDRPMLGAILALILVGIALVMTASPAVAERIGLGSYHFLIRHLIFLGPSIVILFVTSMLEPRMVWRIATLVLMGGIVGLLFVLFAGVEIKGAQRWVRIFGFSLQPSEFVKPAFVIVAAWLMSLQKQTPDFPGNIMAAGLYLGVILLFLLQPDLGMTVLLTAAWGVQIFLVGFPLRFVLLFALVGVGGLLAAYFSFDHVRSRIDRFLNPESGDSYQVQKSLEAFQNGGLFGTGPGQGEVKLRLPDAHADFVFAVAGEELGLIFLFLLMGLFLFILVRGFNRLMSSGDIFVVLAGGGLLALFGFQSLVHMGSSLQLLPAKGMTLPFMSYGGSSLLSAAFGMGAVLALTRQQRRGSVSRKGVSLKAPQSIEEDIVS